MRFDEGGERRVEMYVLNILFLKNTSPKNQEQKDKDQNQNVHSFGISLLKIKIR